MRWMTWLVLVRFVGSCLGAEVGSREARPGDRLLAGYFESETARVATNALRGIESSGNWEAVRGERRRELLEMLGLWPLPERTDLRATVTGRLEREEIVVERLHFQSLPGLYVTANLYRPRQVEGRLPAVLYVCGHAMVKTNGLSCGNKTAYQHHGIWFARHGYVCLMIDTLQLGEIEGLHHGTYRLGQWWWNGRGYTPAGVEAWNSMRAIDYLESRPEVDARRIGMTGRSGGGSYTWTTAAIDDRVRVAAPVAGMTDLRNQVVDGVVEGHCDCMFYLNAHRWDFAMNAALIAPRPLLIVNTDSDTIFPLDGVERLHAQVRRVYEWYGAKTNLGLVIAPGPHKDTQDLQVPVFRWFDRFLAGREALVREPAVPWFSPLELRVFDALPADERNTRAQEWFGAPPIRTVGSADPVEIAALLRERCFVGWPEPAPIPSLRRVADRRVGRYRIREWDFETQPGWPGRLVNIEAGRRGGTTPTLRVVDETGWKRWESEGPEAAWREVGWDAAADGSVFLFAPRGIGPTAWSGDDRKQAQIRRRFLLLGQTLEGMRVWDIRRAVQAVAMTGRDGGRLDASADGVMGANVLMAALFEPSLGTVAVRGLPASIREGPDYLNAGRITELSEVVEALKRRGTTVEVR